MNTTTTIALPTLPTNFDDLIVHHAGDGRITIEYLDLNCKLQQICSIQLVVPQ